MKTETWVAHEFTQMSSRSEQSMWYRLLALSGQQGQSLQSQLREALVKAILDGHIPRESPLPSSRELAKQLGVARNTVVLAYQHLIDEKYIVSHERRGYFVNPDILDGRVNVSKVDMTREKTKVPDKNQVTWEKRLSSDFTRTRNIVRPRNWQSFEYPFIYGQVDPTLFPVNDWRESCRLSLRVGAISEWTHDSVDHDDELLVEQIHTRVLPRRGVWAAKEEILITAGAQNALFLLAQLLLRPGKVVGLEDPCYVDARNIFGLFTPDKVLFPVANKGVCVDRRASECDLVYVTPSHQCPTTTTLPLAERENLLRRSREQDFIIIEDDYESELNFMGAPTPALKSLDKENRVIYVGSLSKTLAPGLRVGFMVGPRDVIDQARALRRLMYRHPPTNNQRTVGHFLALGHHDSVMLKISQTFKRRWMAMDQALSSHMTLTSRAPAFGGSSFWVELPVHMSASELERRAALEGIIINSGGPYFASRSGPDNFFRLGFSSIPETAIESGIQKLAEIAIKLERESGTGRSG